jgi:TolA-binding protein
MYRKLAIVCTWVAISAVGAQAAKNTSEVSVAKAVSNEQRDREVDQVALSAQDLAISRLGTLLKKHGRSGSGQEAVLLAKLAEIQQQKASIQFRLAHGAASRGGKKLDLNAHHKTLHQSIEALDRLIARFPNFEEIPHAYFLRGKAYEDIENKAKAGQNYLYLVKNFPNAEDSTSAYMALAEFAIQANDHARAIGFLKEVEKRPEDPQYPFALYKLAWSHYNLKRIAEALAYAEKQISFYNERAKRTETNFVTASDVALRENTLLDVAVFYFEGYEQKNADYTVDKAMGYFVGLAEDAGVDGPASASNGGSVLGKMLLRFAKLLRSHSHEADLAGWKAKVLADRSRLPESLDVVILNYEYALNNYKYDRVIECAKDMVTLYPLHKTYESFGKAQKQVLDTAEGLQQLVIKNKDASEVGKYSRVLAQIYDAFVHLVEETDPRIPRAHYNLAETLFTIKDYAGATDHYRWVVEHGKWDAKPVAHAKKNAPKAGSKKDSALDQEVTVADASLKAIAARYEVLHLGKLIPKALKPQALRETDTDDVPPQLAQWVEWLDTHVEHTIEGTENFVFESNRALYAAGQTRRALLRMAKFSAKHPKSTYAIPQASLVLDTYIASQDWERTHDTANEFMDVAEWKQGDFSKRLFAIASDAFYKQLEAKFRARDYKSTLKGCDQFLKRYAASSRLSDTLALAGSAALEDIDRKRAAAYFTRLINDTPKSSNYLTAVMARATLEEDHYLFRAASQDYRAYIARMSSTPAAERPKDKNAVTDLQMLRKKALVLSWLSGDRAELKSALTDKGICNTELASDCDRYSLLSRITGREPGPATKQATADAFDKARHESTSQERAMWAILALEGAEHLAFRDRNAAITQAAKGWESLDPLFKFTLLPYFSRTLASAFRLNRGALKDVAPLKAHEKWITRRVEVIREMENAATQVMKLPWARIRAEVLNETAGIYLDLARGLAALPAPKDLSAEDMQAYEDTIRKLTMPFEEKGQDMRGKAFEIASRFAIEETSFKAIAEPFFAENPSQAKTLKGDPTKTEARKPASTDSESLGLAFLSQIDSKGGWSDLISTLQKHPEREASEDLAYENPTLYLKNLWGRAVHAKRLPQVAFFMQEAQEKALIESGLMGAIKAVSLATAGARGEGFAELEETRGDLPPEAQNRVTAFLARFYERSYAREKSEALLKEIKQKVSSLFRILGGSERRV